MQAESYARLDKLCRKAPEPEMGHHIVHALLRSIQQPARSDFAGEWVYSALAYFEQDALFQQSAADACVVFPDLHRGGRQIDGIQRS